MTTKEILQRIQHIKDVRSDDEVAHSQKDTLYEDFISTIAKRKDGLGIKARLILTTKDIDFARWCA